MTVREALTFFSNTPKVLRRLQVLDEIGLGYLRLGQPATTLSGGEAQRIKIAAHLTSHVGGNGQRSWIDHQDGAERRSLSIVGGDAIEVTLHQLHARDLSRRECGVNRGHGGFFEDEGSHLRARVRARDDRRGEQRHQRASAVGRHSADHTGDRAARWNRARARRICREVARQNRKGDCPLYTQKLPRGGETNV